MIQHTNKIEPSQPDIRAYYDAMMNHLERIHGAIWEEIKHFTWFLSVLVGAPFILLTGSGGEALFLKYGWVFFLIGAVISLVGAIIIYREGQHLLSFAYYVHRVEWVMGLYNEYSALKELDIPDRSIASKHRADYFDEKMGVKQFVAKNNRFRLSSVRWLFIVLFAIYFVATFLLFLWIVMSNI